MLITVGVLAGSEDKQWDPRLEPYVAFVEETRGLEFSHPVDVRQVDVAEAFREGNEAGEPDHSDDQAALALTILGFIADEAEELGDLDAAVEEIRGTSVAAFYDPNVPEIVLPPGEIDIPLGSVLVHELTHALQDQNDMLSYQPVSPDDAAMQLALIEGDANRIQLAWLQAQSQADLDEFNVGFESDGDLIPESSFLDAVFASPYVLGEPVVELIVARRGEDYLNRVLIGGLGSTELLIDPLSSSPKPRPSSKRLAIEPEGAVVLAWGTLGPVLLYQLLAPSVGPEVALNAVAGYDIDGFVVYSLNSKVCVDTVIWTDLHADSEELQVLFDGLGVEATTANRGVPQAVSVGFTVCEGEPLTSPSQQNIELLYPVSISSWLLGEWGGNSNLGRCMAFKAATQATEAGITDWEQVQELATAAVVTCA